MDKPTNPSDGEQYVDQMNRIREWDDNQEQWNTVAYKIVDGERKSLMEILSFYKGFLEEMPDDFKEEFEGVDDEMLSSSQEVVNHFLSKFSK